jgi:hypothetical protein
VNKRGSSRNVFVASAAFVLRILNLKCRAASGRGLIDNQRTNNEARPASRVDAHTVLRARFVAARPSNEHAPSARFRCFVHSTPVESLFSNGPAPRGTSGPKHRAAGPDKMKTVSAPPAGSATRTHRLCIVGKRPLCTLPPHHHLVILRFGGISFGACHTDGRRACRELPSRGPAGSSAVYRGTEHKTMGTSGCRREPVNSQPTTSFGSFSLAAGTMHGVGTSRCEWPARGAALTLKLCRTRGAYTSMLRGIVWGDMAMARSDGGEVTGYRPGARRVRRVCTGTPVHCEPTVRERVARPGKRMRRVCTYDVWLLEGARSISLSHTYSLLLSLTRSLLLTLCGSPPASPHGAAAPVLAVGDVGGARGADHRQLAGPLQSSRFHLNITTLQWFQGVSGRRPAQVVLNRGGVSGPDRVHLHLSTFQWVQVVSGRKPAQVELNRMVRSERPWQTVATAAQHGGTAGGRHRAPQRRARLRGRQGRGVHTHSV